MKFAWLCSHESYQPEALVEQAVLAESAGFDMVLGSDHFHPWVDDNSAAGFVWSWLGAVAAKTSRVELGTAVTCPLFHYHPAMIAQATATVDRLSGGRFTLGLGTGEAINESPMGFAFPGYAERMARMGEALTIIRRLLDGEKVDFAGSTTPWTRPGSTARRSVACPFCSRPAAPSRPSSPASGPTASSPASRIPPRRWPRPSSRSTRPGPGGRRETPGTVLATRWTVLADGPEQAWAALSSMRGLRAPGRLEVSDPMVLRERADAMDREEILGKYTVVPDYDGLVDSYRPLLHDIGAATSPSRWRR